MPDRQLHLLSASRMPTSYPLQLAADEVAAWLNGYAALWHPAALAGAAQPPQASVSYDHDTPTPGFIYCTPRGPHLFQPDDWRDRVVNAPAIAFDATADRAETVSNLLTELRESGEPGPLIDAPDDVVRAFRGLGFGYLVLDNLYEAADHVRLLDAAAFWADVAAALDAAARSNPESRAHLKAAAEKLLQAREQIHSQRMHWIDFVQLDPGRLNATWPESLHAGLPVCVAAAGEVFERLAAEAPERFAELRARFLPDLPSAVDLCCGSYREREDALLAPESQWWNLHAARAAAKMLFGVEPAVYARKSSAFHPQLPGWLYHMGFKHAVLVSQDGALIPTLRSTAVNWPGPDGRSVEAFCREPLPAADPNTFFNLVYHMHQAFSSDAAPTMALVHRGEPAFESYRDLLALNELVPVFGEFTNLSRYFTDATSGDYIGVQPADEFFCDYLDDRVTNQKRPGPVSGFPRHLRLRRRLDSTFALAALHRSVTPNPGPEEEKLVGDLHDIEREVELRGVNMFGAADELADRLVLLEAAWAKKLADRLQTRAVEGKPGLLLFNPCGFTRRVALELPGFRGPIPVVDPVKAAEFAGDLARLVVEVPPLGFAWVPREGPPGTPQPKMRMKLADGLTVRNEFLECDVDSQTGGIRSFRDMRTRLTRFGQQLVYNPGSKMVARDIAVTNAGSALGEITSAGDLFDDHDRILATFRQRFRAWLGRPVVELRIELDLKHEPTGYPWHSFFAARFGWRDDRAVLFRGVNGENAQTGYTRPVSPDYLEVRLAAERSFLFSGGLPFIQRHGSRMADVILIPEGEQARSFELLLATDRDVPMQTAVGWTSPTPLVETTKGPPHFGSSGWLAHIDMPSLILTALVPASAGENANRAVAARFIETAGFGGAAEVRFARDPFRASQIDGAGAVLQPLSLVNDAVQVEYSAGETIRVLVEWQ
jgi:alpha-mannosidase